MWLTCEKAELTCDEEDDEDEGEAALDLHWFRFEKVPSSQGFFCLLAAFRLFLPEGLVDTGESAGERSKKFGMMSHSAQNGAAPVLFGVEPPAPCCAALIGQWVLIANWCPLPIYSELSPAPRPKLPNP